LDSSAAAAASAQVAAAGCVDSTIGTAAAAVQDAAVCEAVELQQLRRHLQQQLVNMDQAVAQVGSVGSSAALTQAVEGSAAVTAAAVTPAAAVPAAASAAVDATAFSLSPASPVPHGAATKAAFEVADLMTDDESDDDADEYVIRRLGLWPQQASSPVTPGSICSSLSSPRSHGFMSSPEKQPAAAAAAAAAAASINISCDSIAGSSSSSSFHQGQQSPAGASPVADQMLFYNPVAAVEGCSAGHAPAGSAAAAAAASPGMCLSSSSSRSSVQDLEMACHGSYMLTPMSAYTAGSGPSATPTAAAAATATASAAACDELVFTDDDADFQCYDANTDDDGSSCSCSCHDQHSPVAHPGLAEEMHQWQQQQQPCAAAHQPVPGSVSSSRSRRRVFGPLPLADGHDGATAAMLGGSSNVCISNVLFCESGDASSVRDSQDCQDESAMIGSWLTPSQTAALAAAAAAAASVADAGAGAAQHSQVSDQQVMAAAAAEAAAVTTTAEAAAAAAQQSCAMEAVGPSETAASSSRGSSGRGGSSNEQLLVGMLEDALQSVTTLHEVCRQGQTTTETLLTR
jgi:hypothetical protein